MDRLMQLSILSGDSAVTFWMVGVASPCWSSMDRNQKDAMRVIHPLVFRTLSSLSMRLDQSASDGLATQNGERRARRLRTLSSSSASCNLLWSANGIAAS